jgi:Zn-dependent protease
MSAPPFAVALRDGIMYLVALVLSICVHEFGHAFIAHKLGDPLPKAQGRVTLNPIAHIDPIGTIVLPLSGFLFASFGYSLPMLGWGKPVQTSLSARHMSRRFSMKTMHLFIAICGPLMNVLFALLLSAGFVALVRFSDDKTLAGPLLQVIFMNIGLACFNLLPCPPLDGGAVLRGLLPRSLEYVSDFLDRFGFMILFAILATGMLSRIMYPAQLVMIWWKGVLIGMATS